MEIAIDSSLYSGLPVLLLVLYFVSCYVESYSTDVKAPFGITYLRFTPRWVSNTIFAFDAIGVIGNGYKRFRDSAYKLIRSDVNMVVLPASAIQELSNLPTEVASGIKALERDLLGRWTGLHMITETRLHHRLVQRKLTPNISLITPSLEDEVNLAIEENFPRDTDNWSPVQPYFALLKVSARVASRVLVGSPWCHNPEWLDIATNFTEDIFMSIAIMRCFPPWMYTPLGFLLPSVWRVKGYIRDCQRLLGPAFKQRLEELDNGTFKRSPDQAPDGFSWLAEIASGHERDATKLAHVQILLALASIHTTLLREVNVLYDMMSDRSYIDILRQEITEVVDQGWTKSSYNDLHKLDSVLRESQRISPPTFIGLRRLMQQSYTLSDGTHLPKGAYVCIPSYTIENDPTNTEHPEVYDGLRNYKKRQSSSMQQHQFTSTESTVLGFGYGKTACPGRFFASLTLKAILVKLLTEYDFKFPPGQTERPRNIFIHEFLFPERSATVLFKRRTGQNAPFASKPVNS